MNLCALLILRCGRLALFFLLILCIMIHAGMKGVEMTFFLRAYEKKVGHFCELLTLFIKILYLKQNVGSQIRQDDALNLSI